MTLLFIFGVGLSACNPLAATLDQSRHIVMEADAAELAQRAKLGASIDKLMDRSVEVIGKRASEISASAPTIKREGENRIVLDITSNEKSDLLKRLLLNSGTLEIKLVDELASPDDLAAGNARVGSEILSFPTRADFGQPFVAVKRLGGLRGDRIKDAQQSFDMHTNEPRVVITFDDSGSKKFARMSTRNVGRMVAIIYDGKVLAAPSVNEPIVDGSVQISGDFTVQSAGDENLIPARASSEVTNA